MLPALDRPEPGVGLLPAAGVSPLLPLVELVEHREKTRIVKFPQRHLLGVVEHAVVNAFPGKSGGRDAAEHRLFSRLHALAGDIVEVAVLLGVQLVAGDVVQVEPVEGL